MTTAIKTCFKCGAEKPLTEFYKLKTAVDGLHGKCKECYKANARENRKLKIDYYREYDRSRSNLPHRKEAWKALQKTDERKESNKRYISNYIKQNPKKYAAHNAVNTAIRNCTLSKGICEICGDEKVHGHHDDYTKPLDVRWLCAIHHKQWHKENGEGKTE